jgi:NAD+ diphosphatase
MIHEISPHQFNNTFQKPSPEENDYIFHFIGNSLLLKSDGDDYAIPRRKEISGLSGKTEYNFLFTFDGIACFLIGENPDINDNMLIYKEINFFRTFRQKEIAWISIVAYQLMNWYSQNKYCGKCGSATEVKADERAIICPGCKTTVFPKISPAIIVAIVCNNKILLAHNSNFSQNWYSLVAGYADIGESLEEAVLREVREEVGLDVKNIRYYKSQPWPYSGSIMIGFVAEADDNQIIQVDKKEITEAAWFSRENLPDHPANISIAGDMIDKFKNGRL